MKSQTIWESASRPLFVRSVWIETMREGRGTQHRHFILDYEPQEDIHQRRKPTRSAVSPERDWRKETLCHSVSCDLSELSSSCESEPFADDPLLFGSAKIKLQHQPVQHLNRQHLKLLKFYRRPSFTKHIKRQTETGAEGREEVQKYQLNQRMRELHELYSRHSSSQDMQSTFSNACSNPEERLAERVLNWLDLAGKSEVIKSFEDEHLNDPMNDNNAVDNLQYQRQRQRQRQQQGQTQGQGQGQGQRQGQGQGQRQQLQPQQKHQSQKQELMQCANVVTSRMRRKTNGYSKHSNARVTNPVHQASASTSLRRQPSDAVKPITIIFNRDGLPVRFNRPARNIDLCTLASNAVTTRRLAGTLASARLYKNTEAELYKTHTVKRTPATSRSMHTSHSRRDKEKPSKQSSQKRLHDDLATCHMQDSKRQLHIFMPSLPKKGMASPSLLSSTYGADDSSVSVLSRNFNENCKL